jgi:hypothetical protein
MAKTAYIGAEGEVPVYKYEDVTTSITTSNISTYFEVLNSSYYFEGNGSVFASNNAGVASCTAQTKLTALKDMNISFSYSYSSEANYDKFTLIVANTTIESAVSGSTTNKTYSGSISAGQTILFIYAKDGSQNGNSDRCTFSNMRVTYRERTQVGTEYKSVAQKIKKGYIGIDTEVPAYKKQTVSVDITNLNLQNYFVHSNGSYWFAYDSSTSKWITNNSGLNNTTATTTLTAKRDMEVYFRYSYSSETNYDKFTLKVADEIIQDGVSGTTSMQSYRGNLAAGQSIYFEYKKDSSNHHNNDRCLF